MTIHLPADRSPREGEMVTTEVDGTIVAVARVDGALYAFADECTHQGCSLSDGDLEGRHVVCPCHMGTFDITTGSVVSGPPPEPVRTWPVQEEA